MREIKFRAWDKVEKKMISWTTILKDKVSMGAFKLKTGIWMQFTGLKDKNGKEIFEGDILQSYPNPDVKFVVDFGENGDNNCYGFNLKSVKKDANIYSFEKSVSKMEVIGNIYENPELLKEES